MRNPDIENPQTHTITGLAPVMRVGLMIIALFFLGFGGWASLAPLKSAAVAQGVVSVDSYRKTIQHLEGGIIKAIRVRDGDVVTAGQTLIELEETQARATLDLLLSRQAALKAQEFRLLAERDDQDTVIFPEELAARENSADVASLLEGQRNIFAARRETLIGQTSILQQRIAQFSEEIVGLRGQIASQDQQIALINDEIKDLETLIAKGLARKPRLLAMQRERAEITGARGQNIALIARAEQSILETRLRISELTTQRHDEVTSLLQKVQQEQLETLERVRGAQDVLARTTIMAPLAGTVVALQVHTKGGVISPGSPLMDIVPANDSLIIEAQVSPDDIDIVRPGLAASVRFSAFSQRTTFSVEGEVVDVSADRLEDERTGLGYYRTRIEVTGDLNEALGGAQLYPGMQAEVMIQTGEKTLLEYLVQPITQSLRRSVRD